MMQAFAEDMLDVEVLPSLRSQQYPMGPYRKIVVFSAPRTGSSLTYNIFRFIFEDDSKIYAHHHDFDTHRRVLKTHRYEDAHTIEDEENVIYIFTVRNPYSACVSNYRIVPRIISDQRTFAEDLVKRHGDTLLFAERLEAAGKKVIRLYYEDFTESLEAHLTCIENHFSIAIADADKELMQRGYCKRNVTRCIEHLADFKGFLPISGFHGRHIATCEYSAPDEFLYWLGVSIDNEKPFFRKYGYFTNE